MYIFQMIPTARARFFPTPVQMSIDNPEALVEAFKNSGEFDCFQKELLAEFQKDETYSKFKANIGDIVRKRLAKAQMLHYLPKEMVSRELSQEVERYPIVDGAVKDLRMFSDPAFISKIQKSLQKVLQEHMQKSSAAQPEMDQDNHCDSHDQGAAFQRAIDNNPSCDSEMVADFQFKSHETGVKGTSHPGHDPQNQVEASPEGPTANDAMDVD